MPSKASNRREQLRVEQEAKKRQQRNRRIVGIVAGLAALILVVVLAVVIIQSMNTTTNTAGSFAVPPNATEKRDGVLISPSTAKDGAPAVSLYLDYQCHYCRDFELKYGAELTRLAEAGDIKLTLHTMTFLDGTTPGASTRAATAATCSDFAGKYPAYNAKLFESFDSGYPAGLLRDTIPGQLGIAGDSLTRFQQCFDTSGPQRFVSEVNRLAYENKVTGTPALHVNGKPIDIAQLPQDPSALKDALLANA